MTIAIPAARQKLIERIATSSRRLRKRADPLPADDFIRQYYHGVAEEDLAEYPSESSRPPRWLICASHPRANRRSPSSASTTPRKPATAGRHGTPFSK